MMLSKIRNGGVYNYLNSMVGLVFLLVFFNLNNSYSTALIGELNAGTGKANITNTEAGMIVNDSLFVKSLVLQNTSLQIVMITVDVVAIEEIGHLPDDYLLKVREILEKDHGIAPQNVIINASHCHGVPSDDVIEKTIQSVQMALKNLNPVEVGMTKGYEDRISINRRLLLNNGQERDIRHAYSLPPEEKIAEVGKIDTEVGILCLRNAEKEIVAIMYNYACHPIQGVTSRGKRGNTAGFPGYASKLIEDVYGDQTMAFFIQGCAGDINPVGYKNTFTPRSSESLGIFIGSNILTQIKNINFQKQATIAMISDQIQLPLADLSNKIDSLEILKEKLVNSLDGTSLSFKTFLELYMKYNMFEEFPSSYAHLYKHEAKLGKEDLELLDVENKSLMSAYLRNIQTMEELSVVRTNLALLQKHQKDYEKSTSKSISVEVNAIKIGEFVMVSFPGELSVQIGLNIKAQSPFEHTYISAYTNGYIYYSPTNHQLKNRGGAQEDSDCVLDMGWQEIFEEKALEVLNKLSRIK